MIQKEYNLLNEQKFLLYHNWKFIDASKNCTYDLETNSKPRDKPSL